MRRLRALLNFAECIPALFNVVLHRVKDAVELKEAVVQNLELQVVFGVALRQRLSVQNLSSAFLGDLKSLA
eukprot:3143293-Pleurochrysis_carterae.AAC.2